MTAVLVYTRPVFWHARDLMGLLPPSDVGLKTFLKIQRLRHHET